MALDMYRHAIAIDLGPNMKSSDLGIHSASMGNVWQCVACGFAGLEWHEGGLSLRSHLPQAGSARRSTSSGAVQSSMWKSPMRASLSPTAAVPLWKLPWTVTR